MTNREVVVARLFEKTNSSLVIPGSVAASRFANAALSAQFASSWCASGGRSGCEAKAPEQLDSTRLCQPRMFANAPRPLCFDALEPGGG
jgi:hypothetical protein